MRPCTCRYQAVFMYVYLCMKAQLGDTREQNPPHPMHNCGFICSGAPDSKGLNRTSFLFFGNNIFVMWRYCERTCLIRVSYIQARIGAVLSRLIIQ